MCKAMGGAILPELLKSFKKFEVFVYKPFYLW